MRGFEKMSVRLRHSRILESADPLWHVLRPGFNTVLRRLNRNGLQRTINGTDPLRIPPEIRWVPEIYEPEFWAAAMSAARPGDTVLDIGAFVGLYTVAFARRVGRRGRVIS